MGVFFIHKKGLVWYNETDKYDKAETGVIYLKYGRTWIAAVILLAALLCSGCSNERLEEQTVWREKGIQLMTQGKYEEALEAFQAGLDLSLGEVGETEKDICYYKAEAQYMLDDTQGAMDTYTAIINYDNDAKAYFQRGNLYYSIGDEENALKDYKAAVENETKDYALYIGVYEALTAHGKEKEAQDYLNQALEIKGDKAYDKMLKGRINYLLGEEQTAVLLLEEAAKGGEVSAYYYLAEIRYANGDMQSAETSMDEYLKSDEVDSYNLFSIAKLQLDKKNYEIAIKCLSAALELEEVPNKQVVMKTLAIAYEKILDFDSAREVLMEYVQEYPEDDEAARELTFLETR